jgi:hypothetical protein
MIDMAQRNLMYQILGTLYITYLKKIIGHDPYIIIIYGDEKMKLIQMLIDSDHALHDIMCLQNQSIEN